MLYQLSYSHHVGRYGRDCLVYRSFCASVHTFEVHPILGPLLEAESFARSA